MRLRHVSRWLQGACIVMIDLSFCDLGTSAIPRLPRKICSSLRRSFKTGSGDARTEGANRRSGTGGRSPAGPTTTTQTVSVAQPEVRRRKRNRRKRKTISTCTASSCSTRATTSKQMIPTGSMLFAQPSCRLSAASSPQKVRFTTGSARAGSASRLLRRPDLAT